MNERTCVECGTTFAPERGQATCSLTCRRERNTRRIKSTFSVGQRLNIFERDDWTCGICAEPVDDAIAWPHPMSAAVDHIVPISRGGEHAMRNAQCSHWICNSRKGSHGHSPTSYVS